MSEKAAIEALLSLGRAARRRTVLNLALVSLPMVVAATIVGICCDSLVLAIVATLGALATILIALRAVKRMDRAWLARRLNAERPDFDDSIELLLSPPPSPSTLQMLQRARLTDRVHAAALPDLRAPVAWRASLVSLMAMSIVGGLIVWQPWSSLRSLLPEVMSTEQKAADAVGLDVRIEIEPPAYTGLKESTERSLDLRCAAGSRLTWHLRMGVQASAVALVFHDASRLILQREGDEWTGERVIAASTLMRVEVAGDSRVEADKSYRIDVIPDRAPEITVRAPEKTLSLLAPDQKQWPLVFEARDDYGLGQAELSISLAQGEGEQVKVSEQRKVLEGRGSARERRYETTLDLAALGYAQGDDLIVRLQVSDLREPGPNVARSASLILRWPPEASAESAGMEGMVRDTIPAYFRSERQIIIDTEALLAERDSLSEDQLQRRANAIGEDQKLLRLRYGQFLGEEAEGDPREEHEHDAGPTVKRSDETQAMREFGHVHDIAEAATLLDDTTKTLLRSALDAMWQAEGRLRTVALPDALPHEHKALEAIKQVQQSTRIYLARVGLDLPELDATRRLTGDRAGLADRSAAPPVSDAAQSPVNTAWRTLESGGAPDVAALQLWLRDHAAEAPDALGLIREAERLQRDPACASCRDTLRAQLWPLLASPATALQSRAAPDVEGAAYLGALSEPAR